MKFFKKIHNKVLNKTTNNIFMNRDYRKLDVNYDNFFSITSPSINLEKPLIKQIQRVSFELSNICNYSMIHKKCPASRVKEKKVLSAGIVEKVITELSSINYEGLFVFHRYNEPFIDPRLFGFIKTANKLCPNSKILLLTNGFYLTQQLANELTELNIWILAVSAYSDAEFERLSALTVNFPYTVFKSILDGRENIYDGEILDHKKNCFAPLRDLTINAQGEVVLCCLDWENRHVFGKLDKNSLDDIVKEKKFQQLALDLSTGKRNLDICRRCSMVR
ncbi:SPASM domain-containing protein [Thermodesulfobacteriota bacterium]